jgi:choline dehydrogenase-like flavoprotein
MPRQAKYAIIGSGVAASAVAGALVAAKAGPIVVLEAGPRFVMRDRRRWLDYMMSGALRADSKLYDNLVDRKSDFENVGSHDLGLTGGRLWVRGGSTLHWGGWSLRLMPEDFRLRSATGKSADWPLSYEQLETFFCDAEDFLGVAGPSEAKPPRSRPYPFPAIEFTRSDRLAIDAFEKLGMEYEHMPVARNVRPVGDWPACVRFGTCQYCPIGGRFTGDQPIDRLEKNDGFELLTNAVALRLIMADKQRAAAVEFASTKTGELDKVEAEQIILCAGAVESPKILLASTSKWWPAGVGNEADQVGRHLGNHSRPTVLGKGGRNTDLITQPYLFPTLMSRHLDSPAQQSSGKLAIFVTGPSPDVAKMMATGTSAKSIEEMLRGETTYRLVGQGEVFTGPESRVMLGSGSNQFGAPATRVRLDWEPESLEAARAHVRVLEDITKAMGLEPVESQLNFAPVDSERFSLRADHAFGTCRMSASPAKGVVDRDLRVFGTDNVHVCSNAVMPSLGTANPTVTLVGLALRLGKHLAAA